MKIPIGSLKCKIKKVELYLHFRFSPTTHDKREKNFYCFKRTVVIQNHLAIKQRSRPHQPLLVSNSNHWLHHNSKCAQKAKILKKMGKEI